MSSTYPARTAVPDVDSLALEGSLRGAPSRSVHAPRRPRSLFSTALRRSSVQSAV